MSATIKPRLTGSSAAMSQEHGRGDEKRDQMGTLGASAQVKFLHEVTQ